MSVHSSSSLLLSSPCTCPLLQHGWAVGLQARPALLCSSPGAALRVPAPLPAHLLLLWSSGVPGVVSRSFFPLILTACVALCSFLECSPRDTPSFGKSSSAPCSRSPMESARTGPSLCQGLGTAPGTGVWGLQQPITKTAHTWTQSCLLLQSTVKTPCYMLMVALKYERLPLSFSPK